MVFVKFKKKLSHMFTEKTRTIFKKLKEENKEEIKLWNRINLGFPMFVILITLLVVGFNGIYKEC